MKESKKKKEKEVSSLRYEAGFASMMVAVDVEYKKLQSLQESTDRMIGQRIDKYNELETKYADLKMSITSLVQDVVTLEKGLNSSRADSLERYNKTNKHIHYAMTAIMLLLTMLYAIR